MKKASSLTKSLLVKLEHPGLLYVGKHPDIQQVLTDFLGQARDGVAACFARSRSALLKKPDKQLYTITVTPRSADFRPSRVLKKGSRSGSGFVMLG